MAVKRPRFRERLGHRLDVISKAATLKVSSSLVSLVAFSGEVVMSECSGTIIEVKENSNVVVTTLNLIRKPTEEDVGQNILVDNLKISLFNCILTQCSYVGEILAYDLLVDDTGVDQSFQLHPHALKVKVGDPVVVVGRYFYRSFDHLI